MNLRLQHQTINADILKAVNKLFAEDEQWLCKIKQSIQIFEETNDLNLLGTHINKLIAPKRVCTKKQLNNDSLKENGNTIRKTYSSVSKHKVLLEASQTLNQYDATNISEIIRRENIGLPNVKLERLSNKLLQDILVKTEMLPPPQLLKRGRRQIVETEKKLSISSKPKQPLSRPSARVHSKLVPTLHNSDLILQENNITIIHSDSEDEVIPTEFEKKKTELHTCSETLSNNYGNAATIQITKVPQNNNCGNSGNNNRAIEEPHINISHYRNVKVSMERLSDKQIEALQHSASGNLIHTASKEITKTDCISMPPGHVSKKIKIVPKTSQPLFNVFNGSPIKKRVEAFEKLRIAAVDIPTRVTRTKARLKEVKGNINLQMKKDADTPDSDTISRSENVPLNLFGFTKSAMSVKTAKALEACREEFRVRKQRCKAKEIEDLKNKDAFKKAQTEERKRRKEKNEVRARDHEIQERENAKNQVDNKNKRESSSENKKSADNLPIYMLKKAPLLPTYDCYDSDDPRANDSSQMKQRPPWTKCDNIQKSLKCVQFVDQMLKNTFFCIQPVTPDLKEIFQVIDPNKLKRNSSAIWKNIPSFTLMPLLGN